MKRFAAHYLLLPDVGFIRQQVVEIADEGYVRDVFPLTEEIESVEWMPGLIALLPVNEIKNTEMFSKNISVFQFNFPIVSDQTSQCFKEALAASEKRGEVLFPYLFYPFDFTSMQPVAGTRHRLMSASTSFPIPLPSFPITISPLVDNGCSYMFSPSKNVPNTGVSPSE